MVNSLKLLYQEYKPAFQFLIRFVVLYFGLNTLYGLYILFYSPGADPLTIWVTQQSCWILSWFHDNVSYRVFPDYQSVSVFWNADNIIDVFEGCNSLNVEIVFVSFVLAFSKQWKQATQFLAVGMGIIYLMNLARIIILFEVSAFYPESLYFFHKYLFTGIIYIVVFALWHVWIRKQKPGES